MTLDARKPTGSEAEIALAWQLDAVKIPYEREVQFAKELLKRRWRADFAIYRDHHGGYLVRPLLVEIDGGTWTTSRHTTGAGFARDAEKLNRATELGYRVLRFTPSMVEDGSALAQIERCLA